MTSCNGTTHLRAKAHTTNSDFSWPGLVAKSAERIEMRLAVALAVVAAIALFPLLLVLAIIAPNSDSY